MRRNQIGIQLFAAMATLACANAEGRPRTDSANPPVIVCMDGAPGPLPAQARMLASEMFVRIGVHIDWRTTEQDCLPGNIQIRLSTATPSSLRPGALAYAYPYESTRILVFYDRVLSMSSWPSTARLLAHVIAHEITHVLQQIDRHSKSGVMKGHWSANEIRSMSRKPLPFAPEDVDLIYAGKLHRTAS